MSAPEPRVPRPGLTHGLYPEAAPPAEEWGDRAVDAVRGAARRRSPLRLRDLRRFVGQVDVWRPRLEGESSAVFSERIRVLREGLLRSGLRDSDLPETFAVIREAARRTLATPHYEVQLMAGRVMARGELAEMATGEGKTLTATLPAAAAALAGIPVHVISANDYLVRRDAALMRPLYEALGLRVGTVTEASRDAEAHREAYRCDITYATGKAIAFDYMRDRITRRGHVGALTLRAERLCDAEAVTRALLLRGLCFAIVDEADHVLIDEARTPLLLSQPARSTVDRGTYRRALRFAQGLAPDDYRVDRKHGRAELTERGREQLEALAVPDGGAWKGARHREEWVTRALCALHCYERDRHYLVHEQRIGIIDQATGRLAADRTWEQGLHQLIETKEGCPLTAEQETIARVTTQQFFRRYLRLAGTTGTAREVAAELWSTYRLDTVEIPTRLPTGRRNLGTQVLPTSRHKWRQIVARIAQLHAQGRPVLVGTATVGASETLSRALNARGLAHQVLNARQDAREAEIISQAGQPGRITVATAMAGRGTDIELADTVRERGGLHVILTQLGEVRRIDRQLLGRCGRQGDPGTHERILSLDDDLVKRRIPEGLRTFCLALGSEADTGAFGKALTLLAQRAEEIGQARLRGHVREHEEKLGEAMAFAGR